MKLYILIIFILLASVFFATAHTDSISVPKAGFPCPDFRLTGVEHYSKKEVTLKDFKGKWLILDFWGEFCASCIASFPKMNEIQKEFKEDLQVFLVGIPYKDPKTIRDRFEAHRKRKEWNIPIAYDKELASAFGVGTYPHLVIIDPSGIVRFVTTSVEIENVRKMIKGEPVVLQKKYNTIEGSPAAAYNRKKPFLINGNGGPDTNYLFRSILAPATEFTPLLNEYPIRNKLELFGFPLSALYTYAYQEHTNSYFIPNDSVRYGKLWAEPILEVKDTSVFFPDFITLKNMYSYAAYRNIHENLKPGFRVVDLRAVLKNDLELLFPYAASVEKRPMPCNKLITPNTIKERLKSKSDSSSFIYLEGDRLGFSGKRISLLKLINYIFFSEGYDPKIPLVYESEPFLMDITIRSSDYPGILKELSNLGITIERSSKEMEVVVIKDNNE